MQKYATTEAAASWGFLAAVTLGRLAFGFQMQIVASLSPTLASLFHLDYAAIGTLVGMYLLPGIFVALPCGFLGQRFGDRNVLAGGLALMTLGCLASAAASGPLGIGAGRVIAGAGAVTLAVLQGKVVADRYVGRDFMLAMGLVVGGFPIGIGLAQILAAPIAQGFGWSGVFVAGALTSALAGTLFVATFGASPLRTARRLTWPSRQECRLVFMAGLVWAAYNAGYVVFLAYVPSLIAHRGGTAATASLLVSVATWGNLPAILLGSAVASRFGPRRVFLFGTSMVFVGIVGVALTSWPLGFGLLYGTLAALHGGVIIAIGTLSARPEHRAVGMAMFYTTYYLSGAITPGLCGRVADLVADPAGALVTGALISLLAIPFFLLHQRWSASRAAA